MNRQETPAHVSTLETAVDDYHRNGYVFLEGVLSASRCQELREMIDRFDSENRKSRHRKKKKHLILKNAFEMEPQLCVDTFKDGTILPLVKRLIGSCGSSRGPNDHSLSTHVIHNNAFRIDPGGRGQAPRWHADDPPVFSGTRNIPDDINVAPLALTCMCYLNELRGPQDGGTRLIPGSHRFTRPCTEEECEALPQEYAKGPQGSILIISSMLWHRGSSVELDGNARYVFQITYGRRLVGHKFSSIMDYQLPKRVVDELHTDDDRKLMGYLQGGAYS